MDIFTELVEKYKLEKEKEEQYEREQLQSQDPQVRISKKIDKVFKDLENSVMSKSTKMKYWIDQDIFGPSGAEKIPKFDPEYVGERVCDMFDRFEKQLELELEKIRVAKQDILGDLKN